MSETRYIRTRTKSGKEEMIALPTGGVAPHNQAWSTITDTPTTLAGYGITDGGGGGMVYPGAGIALSTGAAWGTSIVNNSANWNTAYNWGNHAAAGYAPTANPTFTGTATFQSLIINDITDDYIPYRASATHKLGNSPLKINGANVGLDFTSALAKFAINGGLHVGGESDPGDNNILIDGDADVLGDFNVAGISVFGDDLSSDSFISGFAGGGWELNEEGGVFNLTIDNLTVRQSLKAYEMQIQKVSSAGGNILVSVANGKVINCGIGVQNIFNQWKKVSTSTTEGNGLEISSLNLGPTDGIVAYLGDNNAYGTINGEKITFSCTGGSGFTLIVQEANDPYTLLYGGALTGGENDIEVTCLGNDIIVSIYSELGGTLTISDVSIKSNLYKIYFDEDNGNNEIEFQADDYIRAQEWTGRGVSSYRGKATKVNHSSVYGYAHINVSNTTGIPWIGADVVQSGNATVAARQNLIYITASDDNNPYIDVLADVDNGDFVGKTKVRLGNLFGITDADFGALSGFGLWSDRVYLNNAYLKGSIYSSAGTIGGFTLSSTAFTGGTGGSAGWCTINSSNGLFGLTRQQTYIYSQQNTPATLSAPIYRVVALDNNVESTLNLPSSDLPSSGTSTAITIIHAYGTGLGAGKYHINGNGYYININGSHVSSFDLDEGKAITLYWDPRKGGQWYNT